MPIESMSNQKAQHLRWSNLPPEELNPLIIRRYISAQNVTLARFQLKRGCFIPEHQHENEQIASVLEGALKLSLNGQDFIVRPGEMLVIPPNQPHSAEALEDTLVLDVFSPPRSDWAQSQDAYLRSASKK